MTSEDERKREYTNKLQTLLDTIEPIHSEAFMNGLNSLRDDRGRINYQKLKNTEKQNEFLESMISTYLDSGVKYLSNIDGTALSPPTTEFEKSRFIQQHFGFNIGQIKEFIQMKKNDYTLRIHENLRDQLLEHQKEKYKQALGLD